MFFSRPAGHKYVGRGDPSTVDFDKDDLTQDGNYHDLDLSAIIPKNIKLLILRLTVNTLEASISGMFRTKSNSNEINVEQFYTLVGGNPRYFTFLLSPNSSRIIEYKLGSASWSVCNITICGWWK